MTKAEYRPISFPLNLAEALLLLEVLNQTSVDDMKIAELYQRLRAIVERRNQRRS